MGASQGLDTGQVNRCFYCLPLGAVAKKGGELKGLKKFRGPDYTEYIDLALEI